MDEPPASWDQQDDETTKKFSCLNVNAMEFVPSFGANTFSSFSSKAVHIPTPTIPKTPPTTPVVHRQNNENDNQNQISQPILTSQSVDINQKLTATTTPITTNNNKEVTAVVNDHQQDEQQQIDDDIRNEFVDDDNCK